MKLMKKKTELRKKCPEHWEYVIHLNNICQISETILKSVTYFFCFPVVKILKSEIENKKRALIMQTFLLE